MMKKSDILTYVVAVIIGFASLAPMTSCHSDDLWNELPDSISTFITEYFPSYQVENYTHSAVIYRVVLKDGPGLTFDSKYSWTNIDGYGSTLPQVLLYDQLPPAIYEYLQETSATEQVFAVARDSHTYTLQLLDSTLTYDVDTGHLKVEG